MTRTVAVVTNIPRPYRRALFAEVKQQLAAQDLELRLLYTSDPAKHVRRGSPSGTVVDPAMESYVTGLSFQIRYDRVFVFPTGLRPALAHLDPDCVVSGGFGAATVMAARWCRRAKVPLVLWSGAWPGRGGGDVSRLLWATRRRLVASAEAFIAYGTAAAEYLASLGAEPDRIFCAWNTVDLEGIAAAAHAAAAGRAELMPKYRLATRNLLYAGTLVESKGLRELVSAALTVKQPDVDWALHLVGAGPLRDELEEMVRAAGNDARFRFHGLRPAADVAELLGVADGLFLPTKNEAWGLVINEAMACGVPVVSSPWAGATRDLVEDGVTGYVVEPTDTVKLAEMMSRLIADDPRCGAVGRAGAVAVREKASLEKTAEGFVSAILCALNAPGNG